jgi:hypothetical protein
MYYIIQKINELSLNENEYFLCGVQNKTYSRSHPDPITDKIRLIFCETVGAI